MSILKPRRKTRQVMIGDVVVGGDAPISVQSMTNTKTEDVEATVAQIRGLESVGCEIVRVAVPGKAAVAALPDIVAQSTIPVVADIHFDYKLGLGAVVAGVHALRINPGNIGARERVETLVSQFCTSSAWLTETRHSALAGGAARNSSSESGRAPANATDCGKSPEYGRWR